MRSELGEAALSGDLPRLQQLIAKGARLDGMDGRLYDEDTPGCVRGAPYYRPLGEAARMNHPACVVALLDAGADINEVNYTGETALIQAVRQDAIECVKILLDRGADVHVVACLGTALAATQPGYKDHAIEIGQLLLAAGCSPTATASYAMSAIDRWKDQVTNRPKVDKKVGVATLEMLRLAQPRVEGAAAAEIATVIAELEQKVGASQKAADRDASKFAKLAQAKGASWAGDVGKLLVDIGNEKNRAAIEQVCKVVLASPAAIAHKQWPALVTKALKLSKTYGDVTEQTYGERLTVAQMESDEGGAMDYYADDHLYTFDWLLLALATPAAIAHPAWAGLVLALCEAKAMAVGYYSFGDDEVCALLTLPEASQHPRFGELVVAARAAFPFASCFGANGALRDPQTRARSPRASTVVNWPPEPPRPAQPAAPTKGPAKKAPAKKAPAKKAPAKKAPAKKAPAKKAPKKPAKAPKRVPAKKPAKAKKSGRASKRR